MTNDETIVLISDTRAHLVDMATTLSTYMSSNATPLNKDQVQALMTKTQTLIDTFDDHARRFHEALAQSNEIYQNQGVDPLTVTNGPTPTDS